MPDPYETPSIWLEYRLTSKITYPDLICPYGGYHRCTLEPSRSTGDLEPLRRCIKCGMEVK